MPAPVSASGTRPVRSACTILGQEPPAPRPKQIDAQIRRWPPVQHQRRATLTPASPCFARCSAARDLARFGQRARVSRCRCPGRQAVARATWRILDTRPVRRLPAPPATRRLSVSHRAVGVPHAAPLTPRHALWFLSLCGSGVPCPPSLCASLNPQFYPLQSPVSTLTPTLSS